MELSSKLATLAKRHTSVLTTELETLIRGIGEAKSKAEEDDIVQRMVQITKRQIKEGLPRKGDNTKALKDLIVYLIYIDMLGHDTSWAAAAIIQLCSHKSLVVKKAAYLAVSLLIDPSNELNIMVTATIQADLRSDNFLVVCTALQAISRCTGPELVSVFMPQVLAALRHDRDHVKKKALLALHRLLRLDPGAAIDAERALADALGHRDPSVMAAALCGLHELIRGAEDRAPHRHLAPYFVNILKQASEGKLGRGWDYHRAPAPFVQIQLLRLLCLLGAGDAGTSTDAAAVILEVWRRADGLASPAGNAVAYECARAATALYPSEALLSAALTSAARFLSATDNNLRHAGIDVLSRLVDGDAGRVEEHQLAIVECLRSPDVTLKRATLDLLFKMAGPGNVGVVAAEVLSYLKESGDDEGPRREAAAQLVATAERLAPSPRWFVDTMVELMEGAADVAPAGATDALLAALQDGDVSGDVNDLRRAVVERCVGLLEHPKVPPALLRAAVWVLGEHGLAAGQRFEGLVDALLGVLETQAGGEGVQAAVAAALGKLGAGAGRALPGDAAAALEGLAASQSLGVQQIALESMAVLRGTEQTRRAAMPGRSPPPAVDPALPFLDGFVAAAEAAGAPPYLSMEDRVAMGVVRAPDTLFPSALSPARPAGPLKFQAYAATAAPSASPAAAAAVGASQAAPAAPVVAATASLFDDLDLGGGVVTDAAPAAPAAPAVAPVRPAEQELRVNKAGGRRWGPAAAAAAHQASPAAAASGATPSPPPTAYRPSPQHSLQSATPPPPPPVDPAKQRLAASLFGGGGSGSRATPARAAAPKAPEIDLLGDAMGDDTSSAPAPGASSSAADDLFGGLDIGSGAPAAAPADPMAALSGLDMMSGLDMSAPQAAAAPAPLDFDMLMGAGAAGAPAPPQPVAPRRAQQPPPSNDPFANLLG